MKRLVLAALAAGALLASGCHSIPDMRYPGSACHGGCDPVFGSCDQCGTCGGDCQGHTPVSYVGHQMTCASGCGEIYWGEWINYPPDPCDPCDNCGNWVGPRLCPPTFWHWLMAGIPGGRTCHGGKGAACTGKGCADCGMHDDEFGTVYSPFAVDGELQAPPMYQPTPAESPRRSSGGTSPQTSPAPRVPATPSAPAAPTTQNAPRGRATPASLTTSSSGPPRQPTTRLSSWIRSERLPR